MRPRLGQKLLQEIQTYYFNRHRANTYGTPMEKSKCLDNIARRARASGFSFSAAAGTMWFSYVGKRFRTRIEVNEETYPQGIVSRERLPK